MSRRSVRRLGPLGMVLTGLGWAVLQQWQATPADRRDRLRQLLRQAKWRPSNLSCSERRELRRLVSLRCTRPESQSPRSDKSASKANGRGRDAAGGSVGDRRLKIEGRIDQAKSSIKNAVATVVDALGTSAKKKKRKNRAKSKKLKNKKRKLKASKARARISK